jgi:hypothetical protein
MKKNNLKLLPGAPLEKKMPNGTLKRFLIGIKKNRRE